MDHLSVVLAVLAYFLSVYTLWVSHLRPFRPVFLVLVPWLRFAESTPTYEDSDGIPTKEIKPLEQIVARTLTVLNDGSRPGRILDLRHVFSSEDLVWVMYAYYLVDRVSFQTGKAKPGKKKASQEQHP